VSGAWVANSTLAAVSGGDCVGATLQTAIGRRDVFTTALKQSGAMLEATVSSPGNGTSCAYSGTLDGNTVALALTSCQADRVVVPCGDGSVRDVQLRAGTIGSDARALGGALLPLYANFAPDRELFLKLGA